MGEKVTFDHANRLIKVTQAPDSSSGEVELDIRVDVYSDGKEDWLSDATLNKFKFPVRVVGGEDLPGEKQLGITYFLDYGWRIRPYEDDHVLRINGNLYTAEGDSPFVQTLGSYNVMVIHTVSNLVDSTIQQLPEIEYASFNGGVTVDLVNGSAGTAYPAGTSQQPVNNFTDALSIANNRGFSVLYIIGDAAVDSGLDFRDMVFVGESMTKSTITVASDADVDRCEFYDCALAGTLDGEALAKGCKIGTLDYINGIIEQCILDTGTITLGGGAQAYFLDCWCGAPGAANIPIIDMGGSGQDLNVRNYSGAIKIANKTGSDSASITLIAGQVELDSTVTNGDVYICGVGVLIDNSNGADVNADDLINEQVLKLARLLKNKMITDPDTGKITIFADDDSTILYEGDLYEDAAGTIPYRGQGAERRERMITPTGESSSS